MRRSENRRILWSRSRLGFRWGPRPCRWGTVICLRRSEAPPRRGYASVQLGTPLRQCSRASSFISSARLLRCSEDSIFSRSKCTESFTGHKNIRQHSGVLLRFEPNFPTYVTSLAVAPNCTADVRTPESSFRRRFPKARMKTQGVTVTAAQSISMSEKPAEPCLPCKTLA